MSSTSYNFTNAAVRTWGRVTAGGSGRKSLSALGSGFAFRIYGDSFTLGYFFYAANAVQISIDGDAWQNRGSMTTTGSNATSSSISLGTLGWHNVRVILNTASPGYAEFVTTGCITVTNATDGTGEGIDVDTGMGTYYTLNGTNNLNTYGQHTFIEPTSAAATSAGFTSPSLSLSGPVYNRSRNAWCDFYVESDATTLWILAKYDNQVRYGVWVDGTLIADYNTTNLAANSRTYTLIGPITIPGSGVRLVRISNLSQFDGVIVNGSGVRAQAVTARATKAVWVGDSITSADSATGQLNSSYGWDMVCGEIHADLKTFNRGMSGDYVATEAASRAVRFITTASDVSGLSRGETITQATSGATFKVVHFWAGVVCVTQVTGTPNGVNDWTGGTSSVTFTPSASPSGVDRVGIDVAPIDPDIVVFNWGYNDASIALSDATKTERYYTAALCAILITCPDAEILVVPPIAMTNRASFVTEIQAAITAVQGFYPSRTVTYRESSTWVGTYSSGAHKYPAGNAQACGGGVASMLIMGNPADGDTITITGTDDSAVVFEFDSNSSVTGSNVAVTIDTGDGSGGNTMLALMAAVQAQTGETFDVISRWIGHAISLSQSKSGAGPYTVTSTYAAENAYQADANDIMLVAGNSAAGYNGIQTIVSGTGSSGANFTYSVASDPGTSGGTPTGTRGTNQLMLKGVKTLAKSGTAITVYGPEADGYADALGELLTPPDTTAPTLGTVTIAAGRTTAVGTLSETCQTDASVTISLIGTTATATGAVSGTTLTITFSRAIRAWEKVFFSIAAGQILDTAGNSLPAITNQKVSGTKGLDTLILLIS